MKFVASKRRYSLVAVERRDKKTHKNRIVGESNYKRL